MSEDADEFMRIMSYSTFGQRSSHTIRRVSGEPLGIGLSMEEGIGRAVVYSVREGSPAFTAGVPMGAFLTAVGSQPTKGLPLEEIQQLISSSLEARGEVTLEVARAVVSTGASAEEMWSIDATNESSGGGSSRRREARGA